MGSLSSSLYQRMRLTLSLGSEGKRSQGTAAVSPSTPSTVTDTAGRGETDTGGEEWVTPLEEIGKWHCAGKGRRAAAGKRDTRKSRKWPASKNSMWHTEIGKWHCHRKSGNDIATKRREVTLPEKNRKWHMKRKASKGTIRKSRNWNCRRERERAQQESDQAPSSSRGNQTVEAKGQENECRIYPNVCGELKLS